MEKTYHAFGHFSGPMGGELVWDEKCLVRVMDFFSSAPAWCNLSWRECKKLILWFISQDFSTKKSITTKSHVGQSNDVITFSFINTYIFFKIFLNKNTPVKYFPWNRNIKFQKYSFLAIFCQTAYQWHLIVVDILEKSFSFATL